MAFTISLKTKDAYKDVKPVNLTRVISLMEKTFCSIGLELSIFQWRDESISTYWISCLNDTTRQKGNLSSNWTGAPYYNLIIEIHGGIKIWGSLNKGRGCTNWICSQSTAIFDLLLSFILLIVFCSWNINFLQILFSGIFVSSFCSSAVISRTFSWKTMKISATEYNNQLSRVQNSELRHLPYMVPKKGTMWFER